MFNTEKNQDQAIADFSESYLIGQNLSNMDLSETIFDRAELDFSILENTNLEKTSFQQTSFFCTNLQGAKLSHAQISSCDFRYANLENAELKNVDFSNSKVKDAIFTDATGLSLEQKIWLKNNGALNICLESKQINLKKNRYINLLKKLKLIFNQKLEV